MNQLEIRYERVRDDAKGRDWIFQISETLSYNKSAKTRVELAEVTLRSLKGSKTKTVFFTGKKAQRIYEEMI